MKRKIKKIIKLLIAGVAALFLIGLAGLWRLSISPLKFGPDSFVMRYIPSSLKFSEVLLRSGQFYLIPELELRHVQFLTKNIHIKAPRLVATWKLMSLLKGDTNVSSVRLEAPEILIKESSTSAASGQKNLSVEEKLKESLSLIPVKYLELSQAQITFFHQKKHYQLNQANIYVLRLAKQANFQVMGRLTHGIKNPFRFRIKGRLDYASLDLSGEAKFTRLVLAELPVPQAIKKHTSFYKDPLDIKVIFTYYPKTEDFYFNGTLTFFFPKISPQIIHVKGEKKEKKKGSLEITSPRLSVAALPKIWPPMPDAFQAWAFKSITAGALRHIRLKIFLREEEEGSVALDDITGEFEAEGLTVHYKKDLPPLGFARGHVSFTKETASILVRRAEIHSLKIKDSYIQLSGLQGDIQFDGKGHFFGPFKSLVWYLNHGSLKKHLPPSIKVESGQVKGDVHLSFPLKKTLSEDDVILDVEATLKKGVFSFQHEGVGLPLKKTDLKIQKNQEILKISGKGDVSGFDSSFSLEEDYQLDAKVKSKKRLKGAGALKGLIEVLPASVRAHIQNPKGGDVTVFFSSEEDRDGLEKIDLDLDLTQASVLLPLFNWGKPKGVSGKLEIDLETKGNKIRRFKHLSLMSKGIRIKGHTKIDKQGKISEVYFNPFIIRGKKGEGRAVLKKGVWDIFLRVPFLNFNPIVQTFRGLSGEKKEKAGSFSADLDLKVETLFLKKEHFYKNVETRAKVRRDDLRFLRVSGQDKGDPVSIRYEPHQEKMVFEAEIPRLETIISGLSISDKIKTKKIQIQASKPLNDPSKPIKGKLFIEEVRMLNAPVFAKLLSLISIEGLIRGLAGEGLVFTDNYAKFEYKDQEVALRRARMMNGSIGVTTKGYVHFKKKTVDLEGVLIPANFLNQLVGYIPLLGTLLTGGKDQGLFSISYTAKGPLKNPEIKSNPLGILAPNILKTLFGDLIGEKKMKPTLT
jgi:hypothetical protein